MKTKILGLLAVGLVTMPLFAESAPSITNGSLTGAVQQGGVPAGWTSLAGSPDTNDQFNNVGGGTPFEIAPSGPSPDGGTWVGLGSGGGFIETFAQTVSGFDVGGSYTLFWYAGNFGAVTGRGYNEANAIQLLVNGASIGVGNTLGLSSDWFAQSLSFVASASSMQVAFRLGDSEPFSYMSIDGIRFTDASVPEPGSLALLGLGLAGLGLSRRRRGA